MSDITERDWRLLRYVYGDLAYEEPGNHAAMLAGAREAVLKDYTAGRFAACGAAEVLGLRDSSQLLVALGDAGLPMPQPPEDEVKEQTATFARFFRENNEAKEAERTEAEDVAEGISQLDRGESIGIDDATAKAREILGRVSNRPPDPCHELRE